jgi:hypothetical protein
VGKPGVRYLVAIHAEFSHGITEETRFFIGTGHLIQSAAFYSSGGEIGYQDALGTTFGQHDAGIFEREKGQFVT